MTVEQIRKELQNLLIHSWHDITDTSGNNWHVVEKSDIEQLYNDSKPKGKTLEERKYDFNTNVAKMGLDGYQYDLLKEFMDYWTEHGENDKKMRFEKEKSFGIKRRLATWKKNSKKWDNNKPTSLANKMKKDFGL